MKSHLDKILESKLWRLIVVLLLASILILGLTQAKAQCPNSPTDTIFGDSCTFINLVPPVITNQTVTNCVQFKPEAQYINMDYIRIQSASCGFQAYSRLDFEIYNNSNCDTLVGSGEVHPSQINVFQGPLDTSIYYTLCVTWKAKCNIDAVCIVYLPSYLPITLEYFKAYREKDYIKLEWKTQTETNNDYFKIEKAGEDLIFTPIVKIYGQGNKSSPTFYFYKDISPYQCIDYYRLDQVDYDGHVTEYGPIAVPFKITKDERALFIYYDLIGRKIK